MSAQLYALAKEDGPVDLYLSLKGQTLEGVRQMQPDFTLVAEAPIDADVTSHWFENGELVPRAYDPLDELVYLEEINSLWYQLEQAPIEVFGHSFDCRAEPDEKRMQESIEFWDQGPVPYWKTADNQQYALSDKQALIDLYDEMRRLRRVRGQALFNQVQTFKTNLPNVTRRDLLNAGWIDV